MRRLVILVLLLSACQSAEPKFKLHQTVIYTVNSFYADRCSGKGIVSYLYEPIASEGFTYRIDPPANEPMCPTQWIKEENVKEEKES